MQTWRLTPRYQRINCIPVVIAKLKFGHIIAVLLSLSSCGNGPRSAAHDTNIYNDIFAAFVDRDYFDMCWQEELKVLRNKCSQGDTMDEVCLKLKYDSLKKIAADSPGKNCVIFQRHSFEGQTAQYFNFDGFVQDPFYSGKFKKYSKTEMIKRLTTPSNISSTFNGKFLDLRQSKSKQTFYDDGTIGSFAFSECLISDQGDRAILYYEYDCGINCGEGMLLLAETKDEQWRVRKAIPVWAR